MADDVKKMKIGSQCYAIFKECPKFDIELAFARIQSIPILTPEFILANLLLEQTETLVVPKYEKDGTKFEFKKVNESIFFGVFFLLVGEAQSKLTDLVALLDNTSALVDFEETDSVLTGKKCSDPHYEYIICSDEVPAEIIKILKRNYPDSLVVSENFVIESVIIGTEVDPMKFGLKKIEQS